MKGVNKGKQDIVIEDRGYNIRKKLTKKRNVISD